MPAEQFDTEQGTKMSLTDIAADEAKHDAMVSEDDTSIFSSEDGQAGVKRIEAVSLAWTGKSLLLAYIGIVLMANSTSLEGQTTIGLTPYATSAFAAHSLISTVYVVQNVMYAVTKPLMAKIADVFGRFEAFTISVTIFVVGYIQLSASNNVKTYASAQIFYAAGSTGLQILQQIFIADSSNLPNRALLSVLPDLPFLWTVWAGPYVTSSVYKSAGWRWGYGIWAIMLPVAFLPLALTLFFNQRRAAKSGNLPPSAFQGQSVFSVLKRLWYELDIFGLLLLCAAISLILLPLTLAPSAKGTWSNASMIAMLVVGGVCLLTFPFWERNKTLAPYAFFPGDLFRNRSVMLGTAIGFFYFMAFYLSVQPYFYSYLQVVQGLSIVAAGHVTQIFSFSSTVAAFAIGFAIKYTGHYKYFITFGGCIYLMGLGLMIKYRSIGTSLGALIGCQIAVGVGGGMLNVPAQVGVQASVRNHQRVAAATAIYLTILEIGGAVGSAISGAVWSSSIQSKLKQYLPPATRDQAELIYGNLTLATSGWPAGSPTRDAIDRAYQETMNTLLTIAVCVSAPIIILSLFMSNHKLYQVDQKVRGRVVGGQAQRDGRLKATYGTFMQSVLRRNKKN